MFRAAMGKILTENDFQKFDTGAEFLGKAKFMQCLSCFRTMFLWVSSFGLFVKTTSNPRVEQSGIHIVRIRGTCPRGTEQMLHFIHSIDFFSNYKYQMKIYLHFDDQSLTLIFKNFTLGTCKRFHFTMIFTLQ